MVEFPTDVTLKSTQDRVRAVEVAERYAVAERGVVELETLVRLEEPGTHKISIDSRICLAHPMTRSAVSLD